MPIARPFPSRKAWDAASRPSRFQAASTPRDSREHKAPTADRKFLSAEAGNNDLQEIAPLLPRRQPAQFLPAPVSQISQWRSTAPKPLESPCFPVLSKTRERPPPRRQNV